MKQFNLTENAGDDLDEIWSHLAETAGEDVAETTLRRLVQAFRELAELPGMGHLRRDLTSGPFHFFQVPPYIVIYQRDTSTLLIHAVLHGSRNIKSIFRQRPQ